MVHLVGAKYAKATAFFRIMLEAWNGDHPDDVKRVTVTALHEKAVTLCGCIAVEWAYTQELTHIPNSDALVAFIGSEFPFYKCSRRRLQRAS